MNAAVIHPSAWKGSSPKFAPRVELLLDHRFGSLRGGYGVCVPMHYFPSTILGPKDASNPQGNRGGILPWADLGLEPLHLYEVCKLSSHVLRYVLEAGELAICIVRCCARSRVLATSSHPSAGGPKGLARVTSSRWE